MTLTEWRKSAIKQSGLRTDRLNAIAKELVQEGSVTELPPPGKNKTYRYATRKPSPDDYVIGLVEKIADQATRLRGAQVDRQEVFDAVRRLLAERLGLADLHAAADALAQRLAVMHQPGNPGVRWGDLQQSMAFQSGGAGDGATDWRDALHHLIDTHVVVVLNAKGDHVSEDQALDPDAIIRPAGDREASPSLLDDDLFAIVQQLAASRVADGHMVPVHEVRSEVRDIHGAAAAGHDALDAQLKRLHADQRIDLISLSETGEATERQLDDSIHSVKRILFYARPQR